MELNVVPFLVDFQEYVRRGIELKYLECNELLSAVIHFNWVRGMESLLPHLELRGMVAGQQRIEKEIKWPFCNKTVIQEQKIK
jgi:hypothetical protein